MVNGDVSIDLIVEVHLLCLAKKYEKTTTKTGPWKRRVKLFAFITKETAETGKGPQKISP